MLQIRPQSSIKEHCFQLRLRWPDSPARLVCREVDYYNELIAHGRKTQAPFPYHLADYICRVLRISPFRYYSDLLLDVMKQEKSYDTIPNFTAADALRETGIGRNQFIDIMNRARAKLMWRVNRGIVKDMLPLEPVPFPIQPWWLVCVVNLTADEYRRLTEDELSVIERGGHEGDCMAGEFDDDLVRALHCKGLVYLDVPVYPNDRFRVSSLEGFVSNRNQQGEDASEKLLYSLFVTASEQATVHEMALTLQADVRQLGAAISLACRLGWAEKVLDLHSLLDHMDMGGDADTSDGGLGTEGFGAGDGGLGAGMGGGEGGLEGVGGGQVVGWKKMESVGWGEGGGADRLRIALMVDANLTSFLMMGSFSTPLPYPSLVPLPLSELKQHAVTLFEGGKLSERSVAELCGELRAVEKTRHSWRASCRDAFDSTQRQSSLSCRLSMSPTELKQHAVTLFEAGKLSERSVAELCGELRAVEETQLEGELQKFKLKQHAVTLFEAGKLSERSVAELCGELRAVEKTQLEGELQKFTDHAFSLRYALSCLRTGTIDITSALLTPRPASSAAAAATAAAIAPPHPAPRSSPSSQPSAASDPPGSSESAQGAAVGAAAADAPAPDDTWSTRSVADSASTVDPSDLPLPIPSHLVASSSSQSLPDSVSASQPTSSHADSATAPDGVSGSSAAGSEGSQLQEKPLHPRAASYPALAAADAGDDDGSSSPAAPPPPAAATLPPLPPSSSSSSAAAAMSNRATFNRVEVLRTESLQGLAPATLHRLLRRDFDLVVSIVPLPKPLNAVVPDGSGPAHFGPPAPAFLSPWAKLFLYAKTASGPVSVVLMRGLRLRLLPPPLVTCDKALVWTWDGMGVGGVGAKSEGSLVPGTVLLHVVNSLLRHSAVMIQPLAAPPAPAPGFSRTGSNSAVRAAGGGGGGAEGGLWGADGAVEGVGEGVGCLTEEGEPDIATVALPLPPRSRPDPSEARATDGALSQPQKPQGGGRSLGRTRLGGTETAGEAVGGAAGGDEGRRSEGVEGEGVSDSTGGDGGDGAGAVVQGAGQQREEEESPIVAAARRAAEVLAVDAVGFVRVIRTEAGEDEDEEDEEGGGAAGTGTASGKGSLRIDVSEGDGAAVGAGGLSQTQQQQRQQGEWVAHSVEFGIPLFDTQLCCQVCDAVVAHSMLTPPQLASQRRSTLSLRSALREFISDYRQHGPVSRAVYTGNVALLRSTSRRWSASFAASTAAASPFSVLLPRRTVRHVPPSPSGRGAGERGGGRGGGRRGEIGGVIAAAVAAVDVEKGGGRRAGDRRGRMGQKHRLSRNFSEFWYLPENQAPSFAATQDDHQDPYAQSNRDPSFTSEEEEDDLSRPAYPGVNMIFDGHLLLPIDLSTYLHGRQASTLVARATSMSQQSIMW
ncbi:unnamed protein product [Closterium sp. NIES-64]|nr:unnamed protein product [Closterium sp. NIES-64]